MDTTHRERRSPSVGSTEALLTELMASPAQRIQRRQPPKYAIANLSWIQPVNDEGQACGPCMSAITSDMSTAGASFFINQPITTPCVLIEDNQSGMAMQIRLKIVRTHQLADWCYEVATEFDPAAAV